MSIEVTNVDFVIPRVTTERLVLREPRAADFAGFAEHAADADARKFVGGPVSTREAWRTFSSIAGSWAITGSGWWLVEERATAKVIGTVGAFYRETTLGLGRDADLELGWTLYREAWKRGYAREAATAALAWGIERHDPPRVIALIATANAASIAVSHALGMHHAGKTSFYGEPVELYVIERRVSALP